MIIAMGLILIALRKKMARLRQGEVARGAISPRWGKVREVWFFWGSIVLTLLGVFLLVKALR